ncbi:glycosyltransferase [Vibrio japonicus]|uniref:Glycosyltransferase n=1 Tax=Vibrio japonicus TaxID=1824638 RepID=A0ABY5LHS2_9VIBR|nr:glycosyltransferase [Vibrio japonicus]UUM30465.1 glycosyltransferase [Vibrio japonicus]
MSLLVATIMSVYRNDNPKYLDDAIRSMLSQSITTDIYIYVDGEICDELDNILRKFESLGCIWITWSSINRGLAYALNELIDIVINSDKKYEYIARMDSDDISRPDRLKKQVSFFQDHNNVDVLGGFCHEFGSSFALDIKKLPQNHSELKKFSVARCPFIHPTVMFRTRVFSSGIRYPINTSSTEDMALWFILLERGFIFANISDVVLDYRLEEATLTRRIGMQKAKSEFFLRNEYFWKLGGFSPLTLLAVYARFAFHLLPESVMKFVYGRLR